MSVESVLPAEKIARGALFAAAVIPLGVVGWLILWNFNFIASIVALGISVGAYALYKIGSGGVIGRIGASVILAITVATLLLAFFAGIVLDVAKELGDISGLSTWEAFTHPAFWSTFWDVFPDAVSGNKGNFAIAAAFGALGAYRTLRGAFLEGAA